MRVNVVCPKLCVSLLDQLFCSAIMVCVSVRNDYSVYVLYTNAGLLDSFSQGYVGPGRPRINQVETFILKQIRPGGACAHGSVLWDSYGI